MVDLHLSRPLASADPSERWGSPVQKELSSLELELDVSLQAGMRKPRFKIAASRTYPIVELSSTLVIRQRESNEVLVGGELGS